jgi:hypothetical protein
VIKGNGAKLDVPGADFWSVENGKIKDFNWYVNVNVMLEQMGIQPDFASAVKAQPGSTPGGHCIRGFLYAPRYFISIPARSTIDRSLAS